MCIRFQRIRPSQSALLNERSLRQKSGSLFWAMCLRLRRLVRSDQFQFLRRSHWFQYRHLRQNCPYMTVPVVSVIDVSDASSSSNGLVPSTQPARQARSAKETIRRGIPKAFAIMHLNSGLAGQKSTQLGPNILFICKQALSVHLPNVKAGPTKGDIFGCVC